LSPTVSIACKIERGLLPRPEPAAKPHFPQEAPAQIPVERCKFCKKVVSVVEPESPVRPTLSEWIRVPMEDCCHAWWGDGDGSGISHAARINPANNKTANPRISSVPFHEKCRTY
jgi:hypothetical protein